MTVCCVVGLGRVLLVWSMEAVFSLKHFNVAKNETKNTLTVHSALFPSTAYDYLQQVQEEAAQCPDVVVAPVDCSHFLENQDASFTAEKCMIGSSGDKQPSEEWQQQQTASFAEIRQFLVQHKALMKKEKNAQRKHLPRSENESEWFHFCFGQQNSKNKLNVQEEISSEGICSHGAVEQGDEGTPALLSIICQMNQPAVLCVLDHHINWLETRSFSLLQGQWIYALLAAVEKPLLADTTYSLRSLARLCSKQKENLTPTQNKEMAALYLIITIVTRYFGQSDLARPS